ncbi:hypothetical protein Tco_0224945, partial [Tanacetum coccineum]
ARISEITFPPLATSRGAEGPLVIEAEIGGHMIHRMSLSPYNGIIRRPEIGEIQAVPSTAHGMLKFPVDGGIVIIRSTILIPGRIFACLTEEKGPGPETCQSHPCRGIETSRGRNHKRSLLSRLAIQPGHGKEA